MINAIIKLWNQTPIKICPTLSDSNNGCTIVISKVKFHSYSFYSGIKKIDYKKEFYLINCRNSDHKIKQYCSPKAFAKSLISNFIWITYRRQFPPLITNDTKTLHYTTDAGWGCMLRYLLY